jgi:hypothetical protein
LLFLLVGLKDHRASSVRVSHTPAVVYLTMGGDTLRSLLSCRWTTYPPIYTCGFICITHEPHSSPFLLKPYSSEGIRADSISPHTVYYHDDPPYDDDLLISQEEDAINSNYINSTLRTSYAPNHHLARHSLVSVIKNQEKNKWRMNGKFHWEST